MLDFANASAAALPAGKSLAIARHRGIPMVILEDGLADHSGDRSL